MREHLRPPSLSISSTTSSYTSTTNSCTLSPRLSPKRDGFNIPSRPGSPSLPSLVPRHGKKPRRLAICRFKPFVVGTVVFILIFTILTKCLRRQRTFHLSTTATDYEIVADATLPREPAAVVIEDQHGRAKWTISIPPQRRFPLRPYEYAEICSQVDQIQYELDQQQNKMTPRSYDIHDSRFMDVNEAIEHGYLPQALLLDVKESLVGVDAYPRNIARPATCEKSMVYVLQADDAGLGATLLNVWLAYGLAEKEGRAFFLDDSMWSYGNWTDYFKLPPVPACVPPPPHHRVPCPPSAAHIVVSSANAPWIFGPDFRAAFADTKKHVSSQYRSVYNLMRSGYEDLFHLSIDADRDYIKKQTDSIDKIRRKGGLNIGLHVRRGDARPWEYQYAYDYLPLERFTKQVHRLVDEAKNSSTGTSIQSQVYLASDDPDVYASTELPPSVRAQNRIVLASRTTLNAAKGSAASWKEESHGWEGGFFREQFLYLGSDDRERLARALAGKTSPRPNKNKEGDADAHDSYWNIRHPQLDSRHFNKPSSATAKHENEMAVQKFLDDEERSTRNRALPLRSLVGRAYLLDLAILKETDVVVCAVSASGCRALAVMMGYDRAMVKGKWVNVEAGEIWTGLDWR